MWTRGVLELDLLLPEYPLKSRPEPGVRLGIRISHSDYYLKLEDPVSERFKCTDSKFLLWIHTGLGYSDFQSLGPSLKGFGSDLQFPFPESPSTVFRSSFRAGVRSRTVGNECFRVCPEILFPQERGRWCLVLSFRVVGHQELEGGVG